MHVRVRERERAVGIPQGLRQVCSRSRSPTDLSECDSSLLLISVMKTKCVLKRRIINNWPLIDTEPEKTKNSIAWPYQRADSNAKVSIRVICTIE